MKPMVMDFVNEVKIVGKTTTKEGSGLKYKATDLHIPMYGNECGEGKLQQMLVNVGGVGMFLVRH